jgi:SnoaL-like protein
MQPSSELRDLMVRLWEAFSAAEVAFVERHISAEDGVFGIGTDPQEWYEGPRFRQVWKDQLQAMSGVSVAGSNPRAYQEGSVGWVADRPIFRFPGGVELTLRVTAVAHREDDEWKLVQIHTSVGVPNEQLLGQPLPT